MKRLLWAAILALWAWPAFGQTTTVTLNATDTDGQAWFSGTYSASLYSPPGVPGPPYVISGTGTPVSPTNVQGGLNGSATATFSLTSNTSIAPSGTQWTIQVCPNATAACYVQNVVITGATQTLNFTPPGIRINMGSPPPNTRAYRDAELISGLLGQTYFNLVDASIHVCSTFPCGWAAIGSGGGSGGNGVIYRFQPVLGTTLTSGDFALSGWGTGATITNITGTDTDFQFTITAGTSPATCSPTCPTVVLTYHDGPWLSITSASAWQNNGTGSITFLQTSSTTTALTMTYKMQPVATDTYVINGTVMGLSTGSVLPPVVQPVVLNPTASQTIVQPSTTSLIVGGSGNFQAGDITAGNIDNVLVVDGVEYANYAAAFAVCGTQCVIDMRGGLGSLALGTVTPGTAKVSILLGPYTYTFNQIELVAGMKIIGESTGNTHGTVLQSIGSNATPAFVIPQTNNQPAQHVVLKDFQVIGASGNTSQDGFFMDCSTTTNTGLWYSNFENITVTGFKGSGLHFRGRPSDGLALNQFNNFYNVQVFRVSGGGYALLMEGANGQMEFYGGEFDGQAQGDGTNIYIGQYGSTPQYPYSIHFYGTTSQSANLGVQLTGAIDVAFIGTHHEALNGGFQITSGGSGNSGILIEKTHFGTVGVNAGAGFLVSNSDGGANFTFRDTDTQTVPDHSIIGAQGNSISATNNLGGNPFLSTGITPQLSPAATLSISHYSSIMLNASATAIATLHGAHAPGETVTFGCLGTSCIFNNSGNISLGANVTALTLNSGDSASFTYQDLTGSWLLTGYTSPLYKATGSTALNTGAIASGTCAAQVAITSLPVVAGDVVAWNFSSGVAGYGVAPAGLTTIASVVSGSVVFNVCNGTAGLITPSAVNVNWKVLR